MPAGSTRSRASGVSACNDAGNWTMPMLGYLVRRLAMTIPTLLLVAIAVFALVRLIPGDPVQVMLGDAADPAQATQLRAQLGLDQPIPVQFVHWIAKLATGDFGHSITNNLAVLPLILDRF